MCLKTKALKLNSSSCCQPSSQPPCHGKAADEVEDFCFGFVLHHQKETAHAIAWAVSFGGDKRDRTADLLNAIQALSQLSYTPILIYPLQDAFQQRVILYHRGERKSRLFFKFLSSKLLDYNAHWTGKSIGRTICRISCYIERKEDQSFHRKHHISDGNDEAQVASNSI